MPICSITHQSFSISAAETSFCKTHGIPLPTIYPYERLRNMFSFYNSIFLYNGTCALTGKSMLTNLPPSKKSPVYDVGVWMDDTAWDPLTYGRDFDFSRPFFEQFSDLLHIVPVPSRSVVLSSLENSDYCNGVTGAKNCYLIFDGTFNEDCLFSRQLNNCKNVMDSINIRDSELCYSCKHSQGCYNLKFSESCNHCSDSAFLFHCRNVKNCYRCSNLQNKEYYFCNKPYSKKEYEEKLANIDLGSLASLKQEQKYFEEMKSKAILKELDGYSNENSTGNYLNQCKDCYRCFFSSLAENVEYGIRTNKTKDSFVFAIPGNNAELIYNCQNCGNTAYNLKFCLNCFTNIHDLEYCIHVGFGSSNCFGCIGLRKKEYCILNKQYSKDDYFELVTRIKKYMLDTGEYGNFFPTHFSPFFYNRSAAVHFFPLARDEALARGFTWEDEQIEPFDTGYEIPDHIRDVPDTIIDNVLKCHKSGKKYQIIKQELDLYRRWNLPIPRIAPFERIRILCKELQIPIIQNRTCTHCHKPIETAYSDPTQQVYCESCYQQAVS